MASGADGGGKPKLPTELHVAFEDGAVLATFCDGERLDKLIRDRKSHFDDLTARFGHKGHKFERARYVLGDLHDEMRSILDAFVTFDAEYSKNVPTTSEGMAELDFKFQRLLIRARKVLGYEEKAQEKSTH